MAKKDKKKDYICNSVHKSTSEQNIKAECVRLWGRYIRNQERQKGIVI